MDEHNNILVGAPDATAGRGKKKGFPPGQDADSSRVPAISDPHARDRNRTDTSSSPRQKQNLS